MWRGCGWDAACSLTLRDLMDLQGLRKTDPIRLLLSPHLGRTPAATWRPTSISLPPASPCTGGYIEAGFHEVVVDASTTAAIASARASGRSTWRISSTLFARFAPDVMLEPLGHFGDDADVRARYPPITTSAQVAAALAAIGLSSGPSE